MRHSEIWVSKIFFRSPQTRRQVSATDPNASWGVVISVDRFVRVEKEEVAEQGWDNFLI